MLTQLPNSDPALLLRYRDRQYSAELLATALLHFDFFPWLKDHPGATPDTICQVLGWMDRPADVLLTLCRASGLITTSADGGQSITSLAAEHMVAGSPWYLGPYYAPIRDTPIVQGFLKVLTTGKPGNWQAKTDTSDWHTSMLDPVFARSFTDLMNSRGITFGQHLARALTPFLSGRRHLLDVAGGSGIYKQRFGSGLNRGGQHRPVIRVGQIQFIQVALITIYQTAGGMKIHQFPGSLQVFPRDVRSPPEDRLHPFLMDRFRPFGLKQAICTARRIRRSRSAAG